MIARLKSDPKERKKNGAVFQPVQVGEQGEILTGEISAFVVVPTRIDISAPGGLSPDRACSESRRTKNERGASPTTADWTTRRREGSCPVRPRN
jgi:hypothetical protein